jgi:hypothetical protein
LRGRADRRIGRVPLRSCLPWARRTRDEVRLVNDAVECDGARDRAVGPCHQVSLSSISSGTCTVKRVGHVYGEAHPAALELDVVVALEHVGEIAQPLRDLRSRSGAGASDAFEVASLNEQLKELMGLLSAEPVSPLSDEAKPGAVRHDGLVVASGFRALGHRHTARQRSTPQAA